MNSTSTERYVPEYRKSTYKNRNRFQPDELRRRRETHLISLRKQKRDDELWKRRKIHNNLHLDSEIRLEESNSTKTSNPSCIPQLQLILLQLQSDAPLPLLKTLLTMLSPQDSDLIPPIDEAIQLKFVPILMKFISSNVYELQYQLLWILINIASGTEKHTKFLIEEHKIIPALLNLITSTSNISLKEEAVLCLGNLCIDNLNGEEVRNTIIIGGGLVKLIEILLIEDDFQSVNSSLELKRKASWVFMQLCKTDQYGRLPSSNWNVLRYIIPQLYLVLNNGDQDIIVLKSLLRAIQYLTNELLTNNRVTTILDFKIDVLIIHKFLKFKKYNNVKVICLQIIKNIIMATSQKETQNLIDGGLLRDIFYIFTSPSTSSDLKKECCSVVGLVCQCSAEVIQQVFDTSLIPHLIHCLKNGDSQVKVEACNALCNTIQFSAPTEISKQASSIIPFLISQGILSPLCEMLQISSLNLTSRILKSLERILATGEYLSVTGDIPQNEYLHFLIECGGRDILERLISDSLNDEESDLNVELLRDVETMINTYLNYSNGELSSDLSSGESLQYQVSYMNGKDEDEDVSMVPEIGDDGFYKFG